MNALTACRIDRLADDHDRVRATVTKLDAFLYADAAPSDPEFPRLRWQLVRELAAHLAVERRTYPEVRGQVRGEAIYRGIDHALDDEIAAHVAAWNIVRIEADWMTYRRSARLLLRRLRLRMAYEEAMVFPALAAAPAPAPR